MNALVTIQIGLISISFSMGSDAEFWETPIDHQLDDAQFTELTLVCESSSQRGAILLRRLHILVFSYQASQLTIHSALDVSTKNTILSAGSIDTPKILLLSGIGASEHLKTHDSPIIFDQPSIGFNLRDHVMMRMTAAVKPDTFTLPDPAILQGAREQ